MTMGDDLIGVSDEWVAAQEWVMTGETTLYERVSELAIVCTDLERQLASQIAANEALRAQLQEKWIRINELERNNALMAEQLTGANSQPADPLLHS